MKPDSLMKLRKAIIEQDSKGALESTKALMAGGAEDKEIIDAIAGALKEVGDLFGCGELFLPEVMRAANAAKTSLNLVLGPNLGKLRPSAQSKGRVAIGSLGPHDIGKTIVIARLIADGFDILDMGASLSPDIAEKLLKENQVDVVGLSVLLTSDVEKAAEIIRRSRKVVSFIKVMVGGAAMNEKVSQRIGADAYGLDAADAVALARKLIGEKH